MHRRASVGLVVAACAMLQAAFVFGTPPDEEEFRYAVLTSLLHLRALGEGTHAFWTSFLGFGVPQPFIPNFWYHPLLPLLAILEPATWVRLLLFVHTIIGAAGMWDLCTVLALRPVVRAACTCTFLLSAPAMNYALTDTWPSHWVVWTSMPWLVSCVWRLLDSRGRNQWLFGVLLGLASGLVLASANPANAVVYGAVVAGVMLCRFRDVADRWPVLCVSALIMFAVASPNAAVLVSEREFYASDQRLVNDTDPLPLAALWDVFLRPLSRTAFPRLDLAPDEPRTLFFGGPFAVLCLVACARRGWHRRELVAGLAIATAFLFTTLGPIPIVSARYQFRDPVILCAIPLAGMAAERGLQRARLRNLVAVALALQIAAVALAVYPFVRRALAEDPIWFRGATAAAPEATPLVSALGRAERVLFSAEVDRDVINRAYLQSGLGVNALGYRRIPVISGSFKGVSADSIWPDERLFYARVATPQALLTSGETLDVLGVRYVVARRGESVAPDLRERPATMPTAPELVVYENEDAWSGAFVVDADAGAIDAPPFQDCANDRLLCRDLSAVAHLHPIRAAVRRSEGAIDVSFDRLQKPGVVVVSEMFRPAWTAMAGGDSLPTFAFLQSLLAVRVTAGATSVHLAYRPSLMHIATLAAWVAIAGSLVALVRFFRRRHAPA